VAAGKQRPRSFQPNHIGMLTHEFQDSPPLPDLRERASEHAVVCLVNKLASAVALINRQNSILAVTLSDPSII